MTTLKMFIFSSSRVDSKKVSRFRSLVGIQSDVFLVLINEPRVKNAFLGFPRIEPGRPMFPLDEVLRRLLLEALLYDGLGYEIFVFVLIGVVASKSPPDSLIIIQ